VSEPRLLIVDDEESFRTLTARELKRSGYAVEAAGNLAEARTVLARESFHVVLLDVRMPDGSGLDLLPEIRESAPGTDVIMLTAFGTVQDAIRAMKEGAHDFLTKPYKLAELEVVLEKVLEKQALERGNTALQREVQRLIPTAGFIGNSPPIREMLALLAKVAETDSTVLIRGESGVGKELVARAVHHQSLRSRQPFVVVDCAYTGAAQLKHGLFEVADRGTIFLDEIGEITPPLQVKLLRVIETGTFRRVGGTVDIRVDVRIIAATNRALEGMMKEKTFREDLYYRLNVFSLSIPPLRDRKEDVPLLVAHFIRNSAIAPKRNVHIAPGAMEALMRYPWPGNVRELENVIERALILCDAGVIEPEHLPLGVRLEPASAGTEGDGRLVTLEELERRYVKRVLDSCAGHRQKAAEILGISERNLYRKIKELEGVKEASIGD
jgi:DNA-binding NtrC family response regulator